MLALQGLCQIIHFPSPDYISGIVGGSLSVIFCIYMCNPQSSTNKYNNVRILRVSLFSTPSSQIALEEKVRHVIIMLCLLNEYLMNE